MKTLEKVKQEMAALEQASRDLDATKMTSQKRKRMHKINIRKYEELRMISLLLEHSPSEEFLQSQLSELERSCRVLMSRFPEFRKNNPLDRMCSSAWYKKHTGVTDMQKQRKNIEYILAD